MFDRNNSIFGKSIIKFLVSLTPTVNLPIKKSDICITTIIGHYQVDMLIFALKSFFYFSKLNLPVDVFNDGSLTKHDTQKLSKHFTNVNIKNESSYKKSLFQTLKKYKFCFKYRNEDLIEKFYPQKLFDAFLVPNYKKIIYLDSDIIFLKKPIEIIKWVRSIKKYTLFATEYQYTDSSLNLSDEWRQIETIFREKVNNFFPKNFSSGFLCINKSDYKLKIIDSALRTIYSMKLQNSWSPEQYSLGVVTAHSKQINLQKRYLHLTRNFPYRDTGKFILLHFASNSRKHYYKMVLKLCMNTKFFNSV